MNFDLNTAMAVKERDDGLLEKDTFDLKTAVPVDNVIPVAQPLTVTPEKPNWILSTADKVGSGLRKMFALPDQSVEFVDKMVKNLSHASEPVYTGRIKTGAWEDIPNDQVPYAQRSAGDQTKWEWQDTTPAWEAATEQAVQVGFLAYIGVQAASAISSTLKANQLARDVQKASQEFADGMVQVVNPQEFTKIKTAVGETSKNFLNARDFFMQGYQKEAISRLSALEETAGGFKTVAEGEMKGMSFMRAFSGELKALNASMGEAGQALIKRPNIGQSVIFEGGDKPLTGVIKSITGDLVHLDMGTGAKEIVATLSQLSLPKVEEVKQPTEGKVTFEQGLEKIRQANPKVTIETSEEGDNIILDSIFVNGDKKIGEGLGSKALKDITNLADETGKTIILKAQPYGKITELNTPKALASWYKRHGFKELSMKDAESIFPDIEEGDYLPGEMIPMVRSPKLSTPTGEGQKPPVEPPKTAVSGSPEEKPVINLKNLKLTPEEKTNIQTSAEQISPELEKVKGKPLTHNEILDAAVSSDILTKVIDRTQSKEVEAALLRTRQHLTALAEEKGISEDFIKTLKVVRSFGTDAARKLGSLRIEAEANEFNLKTKITNKLLENGVELDKIIKASEGLDFKNQEAVTEFYRQFVKPKLWDIISEYRYINLLSSPRTHIVNAFSNLLQVSGLAPATKLVSGAIDVVHSMIKPGAARTHYMSEVPAYTKGAINSIGEAASKALDALKGKTFVERPDVTHLPTGNKVLKAFRYIPQALEASDVFFRTIAEAGELEAQLSKGIELKEAQKIAKDKASYWVFRKALDPENKTGQGNLLSEIDKLTSMVYKLRSLPIAGKLISWFLPFVQTPMNIAKQMVEYSPLGGATIKGSKDKTEQLAKTLIGSIVAALAAYVISKTESTWEMPTGTKEKELFISSGRIPFAIKLGGNWYSYNRLGPIGFPIAIAAASKWYLSENPKAATANTYQKLGSIVGGLGSYFGNQSYVQGITDLMNVVKNAPGALPKMITSIPTQLIPISAFQRWINNSIIDPVYRKTEKELSPEAIIENARTSLIGMTKGLDSYKTPDDEESIRSLPVVNAFSPVPVSKAKDDTEYKDYLEKRREDLIDKKESGDEPKRRTRHRR